MTLERILYPLVAMAATLIALSIIVWCVVVAIVRKLDQRRMNSIWSRNESFSSISKAGG